MSVLFNCHKSVFLHPAPCIFSHKDIWERKKVKICTILSALPCLSYSVHNVQDMAYLSSPSYVSIYYCRWLISVLTLAIQEACDSLGPESRHDT